MARARKRVEEQAEAADVAVANDPTDVFAQATPPEQPPAPVVEGPSLNGGPAHQANEHDGNGQSEALPNITHANTRSDPVAKMRYHNDYEARPQRAAIEFTDGKPSDAVRRALSEAGFRWEAEVNAWETKVHFPTREQDRQRARATFEKVAEMRREELGATQER